MFNKRLLYVPDTNPDTSVTVETLAIGGGGGGGQIIGGGGGAGGMVSSSIVYKPEIEYAVIIGAGGKGSIGYSNAPDTENGSPTTISGSIDLARYSNPFIRWFSGSSNVETYSSRSLEPVVANGGGLGSGWSDTLAFASGETAIGCGGGGSSHSATAAQPGTPTHAYSGYRGGYASGQSPVGGTDGGGGGGGGLGAVGSNAPSNGSVGGDGGIGIVLPFSSSLQVGGGGGGGTRSSTGNNYSNNGTGGGLYGGGRGGYLSVAVGGTGGATHGTPHTGGGGGCGGYSAANNDQQGGNGGSGLVLMKVLTSEYSGSTGGVNTYTDGSYTVLNFRSSGTVTFKK